MSESIEVRTKRYRLLLLEDDAEDAYLLKRMLDTEMTAGSELVWAQSVDEAVEKSRGSDFDAVLLDYHLGGETAKDAIERLPSNLNRLAKIVLTGHDSTSVDEAALGLGVDFFLGKNGLDRVVLERAIRYAIRNREQQNRLRDFSKTVAHDLKGPVGNIVNAIGMLKAQLSSSTSDVAHDLTDIAETECNRVSALISDLQEYAVSQDGQLRLAEINLGDLLDQARDALGADLRQRGATVEFAAMPTVRVDERLMIHAFQNLIQNGVKYNRSARPRVAIEAIERADCCVLVFADNGIGVDPAFVSRIFQPMTRLHGSSEYKGTGLGLAICKEVMERHGGKMWVESLGIEGKGSKFFVQIPK